MALALTSKHHGTIRFYREPKRNGGDLIAVFPKSPDDDPGKRECFVNAPADAGYHQIDATYLRNLRSADGDDRGIRETAEFIVWRVDENSERVQRLMSPIA